MIIGIVGYIGSGKDTIARYIIENYNYRKDSFATSLKDAVASIFGWPRPLLEGDTLESRQWRETVDSFWSVKLKIPNFTPRYALQYIGTDVLRGNFNDDLWFLTLEKRTLDLGSDVIISDVRFKNEMKFINDHDGITIRVARGNTPVWESVAIAANGGDEMAIAEMRNSFPEVHSSESSLSGVLTTYTIENNGSLEDLHRQLDTMMKNHNG